MSLRELARELYRLEREVEEARAGRDRASTDERPERELEYRRLKAERDRLRAVMKAKKEPAPPTRLFS